MIANFLTNQLREKEVSCQHEYASLRPAAFACVFYENPYIGHEN